MPSIRPVCALAAIALTLAAGCSRDPLPTTPSSVAADAPAAASAIIYDASDTDSLINGSEAQLAGFDVATGLLTFNTTKGVFSAALDNSTVFREAHVSRYTPTDPCRQFAVDYNTAGATVDTNGVYQAISGMATGGCLARVQVDKLVPPNPTAPIKSFRPLATF